MEPLNILSETETAPHNNRDFQPWTSNLQLIFHVTTLDTCLTFKVDTHNIRNLSKFTRSSGIDGKLIVVLKQDYPLFKFATIIAVALWDSIKTVVPNFVLYLCIRHLISIQTLLELVWEAT